MVNKMFHGKYNTKASYRARKLLLILMAVILIIGVVATILEARSEQTWDAEFPMANAHVSWEQTFRGGAWE